MIFTILFAITCILGSLMPLFFMLVEITKTFSPRSTAQITALLNCVVLIFMCVCLCGNLICEINHQQILPFCLLILSHHYLKGKQRASSSQTFLPLQWKAFFWSATNALDQKSVSYKEWYINFRVDHCG
jgi:hypothetical protein